MLHSTETNHWGFVSGRPGVRAEICLGDSVMRVAMLLAAMMMLTSSFDIFLVLQAGGNYRLCQLLIPFLFGLAILQGRLSPILRTLGLRSLIIWLFVQIVFIPVAEFWPKSLGYCLWLAFDLMLMFSFVQLFSRDDRHIWLLLRVYLWSFAVLSVFGFVQFLLPLLGFESPFVEQWWIKGHLARVNGFSYEPSYYATYLLLGFVLAGSLKKSRAWFADAGLIRCTRYLAGTGIILSSSRMGIVFMLLDVLSHQFGPFVAVSRDLLKLQIAPRRLRALIPGLLISGAITGVTALFLWILRTDPMLGLLLLGGTGIANTAGHSVIERESTLGDTFEVFIRHPLIGQSLGGVSSAIAALHGSVVTSFQDSKLTEGMSVFVEVLAASGLIGIIPFVVFLVLTIRKPLKLAGESDPCYAACLRALVRSLVFAWAILQFNQNLLRPYLWVHLAILATVYAAARRRFTRIDRPFPR